MNEQLLKLAQRIPNELSELERLVKRAREGWRRIQQFSDDLYLDGVALNLHSFYSGLERLFELIAIVIDQKVPQGSNWHRSLLEQMSVEMPGIRPAVISGKTYEHCRSIEAFVMWCAMFTHSS